MKKILSILFVLISTFALAQNKDNPKNWEYSVRTDEMTEKQIFFATCISNNIVNFDSPFNGGSEMAIIIRKKDNCDNEIMIGINKGLFNCNYNGEVIYVKFDNNPVENFNCSKSNDGSFTTLFVNYYQLFLDELKKSKNCKIQCSFYQQGDKVFSFNTADLTWNH
jgi:hypothetical protein